MNLRAFAFSASVSLTTVASLAICISFISTTGYSEGEEISYSFTLPITQTDCEISGDYLNHFRLGSGSELVYLGALTFRVTPNYVNTCDDDIEIVNVSAGGKESMNEFLDALD